MALTSFADRRWRFDLELPAYRNSFLSPPAPENTLGEVLLGSVYRHLVLGISENEADLSKIAGLPALLEAEGPDVPAQVWETVFDVNSGLGSPRLGGQRGASAPPQLAPFVPEVARYGGVLGKPGRRWNPFQLVLSAVGAARGAVAGASILSAARDALSVGSASEDDLLARFVEERMRRLHPGSAGEAELTPPRAVATRSQVWRGNTPAEQFCHDLEAVISLKSRQTRRQWTVLVEALLRLALTTHFLWLARLNDRMWKFALDAIERGDDPTWARPDVGILEREIWESHLSQPLLELGSEATSGLKRSLRAYYEARIGINVLLHALESADVPLPTPVIAALDEDDHRPASVAATEFLGFLAGHAAAVREAIRTQFGTASLREIASAISDSEPRLLTADSGPARQALFFLRYTMGQLQPRERELGSYDQAYLAQKAHRHPKAPWVIRPGPTMLLLMAHAATRTARVPYQSVDGFRRYLGAYGLHAPAGELAGGVVGRHLEQLGLSVESADAGGGRLLIDPFGEA